MPKSGIGHNLELLRPSPNLKPNSLKSDYYPPICVFVLQADVFQLVFKNYLPCNLPSSGSEIKSQNVKTEDVICAEGSGTPKAPVIDQYGAMVEQ
jgi:hypothetical protein